MAEQEKGRRKYRAVRGVLFSPYLSLVSQLVLGGKGSLSDGSAGVTMLVFFATWCPHCNNEARS